MARSLNLRTVQRCPYIFVEIRRYGSGRLTRRLFDLPQRAWVKLEEMAQFDKKRLQQGNLDRHLEGRDSVGDLCPS